jgi:hypothetical protein
MAQEKVFFQSLQFSINKDIQLIFQKKKTQNGKASKFLLWRWSRVARDGAIIPFFCWTVG